MKKAIAALGGGVVVVIGGAVTAVVLIAVLIFGAVSSMTAGVGAIFADDSVRQQYGLLDECGVDSGFGGATPITAGQEEYVRTVVGIAKTMDVPRRGQIVAIMVALQESGLHNYANSGENARGYSGWPAPGGDYWLSVAKMSLNYPHDAVGQDADSVGLFQQRPSAGWADGGGVTARQNPEAAVQRLLDPRWSAQAFFGGPGGPSNRGLTDISGWESMSLPVAAQTVQASAFPSAYAKWENQATALVDSNQDAPAIALIGSGGGSDTGAGSGGGNADLVQYPMAEGTYTNASDYGMRRHPIHGDMRMHAGADMAAPMGTPVYAAADGVVVAAGDVNSGFGRWVVIDHMLDGVKYSTVYGHVFTTSVTTGQSVSKGDTIAGVGSQGTSTGPHLHFEVWQGGRLSGGQHIDPIAWLGGNFTMVGGGGCVSDTVSVSGSGEAAAVVEAARQMEGTMYSWGGGSLTGPSTGVGRGSSTVGFDCSGLARYSFYQGTNGSVTLPRTSREQYAATRENTVDRANLQPGDLLFYGSSAATVHHVAIYIGNGQMIEAPGDGIPVGVTNLRTSGLLAATRVALDGTSQEA